MFENGGMADSNDRHPLGAPGPFFTNQHCIDCGFCLDEVPEVFRLDDEFQSYVWQQPRNGEERERTLEAIEGCPVEAIGVAE